MYKQWNGLLEWWNTANLTTWSLCGIPVFGLTIKFIFCDYLVAYISTYLAILAICILILPVVQLTARIQSKLCCLVYDCPLWLINRPYNMFSQCMSYITISCQWKSHESWLSNYNLKVTLKYLSHFKVWKHQSNLWIP